MTHFGAFEKLPPPVRKIIQWPFQHLIGVYLILILVSPLFISYHKLYGHVVAAVLSRLMPPFDYLRDFIHGKAELDTKKMEEYEYYYEKVSQLIASPLSEVYGMMGYCYYEMGNPQKALINYKKAVDLNPYYFTYYYNPGVIYFQKGRYKEAVEFLSKAITTKIEYSFNFISSSRVYFPLLIEPLKFETEVKVYLREGLVRCFKLLILSHYKLNNYTKMIYMAKKAVSAGLDDDGFFYYYWGVGMSALREHREAAMLFQEALKKNPDYTEAAESLGQTLSLLGNKEFSQKILAQAEMLRQTKGSFNAQAAQISLIGF